MKFKEILKRLNGISVSPYGIGISWNPDNTSKDIAYRVVSFLEDRRVLYRPSEMELPSRCIQSILEIRGFLNEQIPNTTDKELQNSLRALRVSCRKFLDNIGARDDVVLFGNSRGHWASWEFNGAVGELRGVFGIHIAKIAGMYELDVEDDLASIFPETEDDDFDSRSL